MMTNKTSPGLRSDGSEAKVPFQYKQTGSECFIAGCVRRVQGATARYQRITDAAQKEIPIEGNSEATRRRWAKREAKLLRKAAHFHVVNIITTYFGPRRQDGTLSFYIVMPFIERDLNHYIRHPVGLGEPIQMQWFGCLISALAHIHAIGIWHRDIKPENILVQPQNNKIFLADFDISEVLPHDRHGTRARRASRVLEPNLELNRCGTPPYLAPELEIKGPTMAGLPSDVFSMGLVFIEMLAPILGTDDQVISLRKARTVNADMSLSYAKNMAKVEKALDSLIELSPGNTTEQGQRKDYLHILQTCRKMLAGEPHKRPTAQDLRLWWQLRAHVGKLAEAAGCDCPCNALDAEDIPESEYNSEYQRAYENGNRLVAEELRSRLRAAMEDSPRLLAAAKGGLWDVVKEAAGLLATTTARDYSGKTALHYLAGERDLDPVEWNSVADKLLERGADILAKDFEGRTPLRLAAETGSPERIGRLLGIKVPEKEEGGGGRGGSIFQIASRNEAKSVGSRLVELLGNGGPVVGDDSKVNICRHEVLSGLLSNGSSSEKEDGAILAQAYHDICPNSDLCQLLVANKDFINERDGNGQTLLSIAAMHGHEAMARLLLHQGSDVDTQDSHGCTPLSIAANFGYEGIVRLLLDRHALKTKDELQKAIDRTNRNNQTSLFRASDQGHLAVVKLLLDHDADTSIVDEVSKDTAFQRASRRGYWAIVKLLLEDEEDNPSDMAAEIQSAIESANDGGQWTTKRILRAYAIQKNPDSCVEYGQSAKSKRWRWLTKYCTASITRVSTRLQVGIRDSPQGLTWFMVVSIIVIILKEIFITARFLWIVVIKALNLLAEEKQLELE